MSISGRWRRSVAAAQSQSLDRLRLSGWFAWWFWLLVHIYRLSGFRNRLSVLIQWAWSYLTFSRGARLIVGKEWRAYATRASDDVMR